MQNKNTQTQQELSRWKGLLSLQLSSTIQKRIKANWKLGRIFNHIRKMKTFENMSDLGILRSTLFELKKLNKLPSREQTKHHFRTKVSKDNYLKEDKREILSDLYNLT